MSTPLVIPSDVRIQGTAVVQNLTVQNPFVTAASLVVGQVLPAASIGQQYTPTHRQKGGTAVTAQTEDIHIVYGASGQVIAVQAMVSTPPTGDHTVTIDVQVAKQGESFTSVLNSTFQLTSSTAALQIVSGSIIASPLLEAGDVVRVIVTVGGSTSSQGQGLIVMVVTNETPT